MLTANKKPMASPGAAGPAANPAVLVDHYMIHPVYDYQDATIDLDRALGRVAY